MFSQSHLEPNIFNYFGIEPTKDYDTLKKEHRKKAKKNHPDKLPENATDEDILAWNEAMQELNRHWELTNNEQNFKNYCERHPEYFWTERNGQTTFNPNTRYRDDVNEYMNEYKNPDEHTIVPVKTDGEYQFFITPVIKGKSIVLNEISNNMPLGAFVEQIQEKSGIPIEQQRLVYAGKIFFDYNNPEYNDLNETLLNASYRCCGQSLSKSTTLSLVVIKENRLETSSTVKPNLPEPFVDPLQAFRELRSQVNNITYSFVSIFNPDGTKAAKAKVLEIIDEALLETITAEDAINRLQQCLNILRTGSPNSPLIQPLDQFVETYQNNPQLITQQELPNRSITNDKPNV